MRNEVLRRRVKALRLAEVQSAAASCTDGGMKAMDLGPYAAFICAAYGARRS